MIGVATQWFRGGRSRSCGATVLCLILCVVLSAVDADAGDAEDTGWQIGIGPIAGALAFDPGLENYRWDIHPALQSGFQAAIYRGRFAGGARLWRTQTTQASGIPGEDQSPRVSMTAIDATAQFRAANVAGVELWGVAHTGILHLGYNPDRLSFDTGGTSGQITVEYKPITEWEFGGGVEIRRELTHYMALAVQADTSTFALDTAHRRGSEIVEARERFVSWSVRFQLSWLFTVG